MPNLNQNDSVQYRFVVKLSWLLFLRVETFTRAEIRALYLRTGTMSREILWQEPIALLVRT